MGSLSLREVARRAGYSPAAVYRYFEGKEGLIAGLVLEADSRAAARLKDVSPELPAGDRLVRLALAYLAFAHYDPPQFSLLLQGGGRPAGEVFGVFLEAARSGVESGELRPGKGGGAEAIAYSVLSAAHGMAALGRTHSPIADLDTDAAQRDAIMRLVAGSAPAP